MTDLNKRDLEDIIDYQERRRFVNWILKYLIVIATGVVIIFGSYIGIRHKVLTTFNDISTTLESTGVFNDLMEDATGDPADGIQDINTSINY